MIQGCMGLIVGVTVFVTIAGRKEEGLWRYRGIRWIWRLAGKKGRQIPEWLTPAMVLRTWMLLFAGSVLILGGGIVMAFTGDSQITRLKRPEYGQGNVQEELDLEWEEENGRQRKERMYVEVGEKKPAAEEIEEIFKQAKKELDDRILGENTSAECVNQSLYLPETLEGFPVSVSWTSSAPEIVDWEGNLGEKIPEEGEIVGLTATIRVEQEEDTCFWEVKVFPRMETPGEELQTLLKEANENQEESWMNLPEQIQGQKIHWKKSRESTARGIAVLLFLCPFLLLMRDKQAAQEEKKRERQQMMQDYPEILSKLTLLLSAGMNLRKSMERIGKDYMDYRKDGEKRKAYEVILQICEEMNRGVSEKEAYERLGERCGILSYRTLSALLVQHLQKGSRGMERILEEEAQKAQEMRQQQAKVLGEQASTKLLVPMILMLLVVFVILLVPAWLTFAV